MDQEQRSRTAVAVVEPVLAVALAGGLTLLLTWPFLPIGRDLEIRLRARPQARGATLEQPELLSRVEALGLASRVEVVARGGGSYLVLHGAPSESEAGPALREVLEDAGFQTGPLSATPAIDLESVLRADPTLLAAMLSLQAVVFLCAGLILRRLRAPGPWPGSTPSGPLRALLVGLAGGSFAVLSSGLISVGMTWAGLPVREQAWLQQLLSDRTVLRQMFPWLVIVGPVAEEVFFRGYAYRFLRGRVGLPVALLVSSTLFALIHFNVSGFLVYLVIGCSLAWAYERTGNLLAPIVGHVIVNGLALLSTLVLGP